VKIIAEESSIMTKTYFASALLCAGLLGAPAVHAADASGETIAAQCNGCHGDMGRSKGAAPAINGLPKSYLVSSMNDFKADKRPATIMNRIAKGYSDQEIENVAEYYSSAK
jgi:cytochrome c553